MAAVKPAMPLPTMTRFSVCMAGLSWGIFWGHESYAKGLDLESVEPERPWGPALFQKHHFAQAADAAALHADDVNPGAHGFALAVLAVPHGLEPEAGGHVGFEGRDHLF